MCWEKYWCSAFAREMVRGSSDLNERGNRKDFESMQRNLDFTI